MTYYSESMLTSSAKQHTHHILEEKLWTGVSTVLSSGKLCEIGVLGLARTGLIFTRLQEGAQPGGLTPPGQTEQGIPYHVPSCWVPVGRSWAAGTHLQLRSLRWGSWRAALWVVQFVLYFLLICIVVVPVPFVYCSVKLPLSRPTSFLPVSFHSSPQPSRGRGGHVALLLLAAAKL